MGLNKDLGTGTTLQVVNREPPQWTHTPPTEPGWYWVRQSGITFVGYFIEGPMLDAYVDISAEFWPVKLEEPK
jgi:hypothetical protein